MPIADQASELPVRWADRAYEQIKSMAITYRIRPGDRINEVELAKRLDMSRTPVREALNRLVTEGFLTAKANKGFFARPLDAKQIFSLYEFRSAVEAATGRIACERATDVELDELEGFVHASKDEKDDVQATRLLKLDEEFHERIAVLSCNPEFVRTIQSVNNRIHFVRWIDMQNGRRAHTQGEHLQIVKALKRRDADAVAQILQGHISRRLDQIVDVIKQGYFEIYSGGDLDVVDQTVEFRR